jgi:UDP-2,3-diacylglucosamine pyrophosphatase LpxH
MKSSNSFKKVKKTIIVLSDLHLGAGHFINGVKNQLEDFHFDKELSEFFHYFSTGIYQEHPVEIIINGDFLDFLATPYVKYFDDKFWSEEASVEKLKIIANAHEQVFKSIEEFLKNKNKKLVYIVGNHDAEIILPAVRQAFFDLFDPEVHPFIILPKNTDRYLPAKGVYIMHGHQYERAHEFEVENAIVESKTGKKYIHPTWGAYYCVHIINKFKRERTYINQIQPIKKYLIHGLLYDTFFTIRFMFAHVYFFAMVRFWYYYLVNFKIKKIFEDLSKQLVLFQNYEHLTKSFFRDNCDAKLLCTGHTHHPMIRPFQDGTMFLNTGTWTKIISLDFTFNFNGFYLTFAHIELEEEEYELDDFQRYVKVNLYKWRGETHQPYEDFDY